jgi:hypothetical protein
MKRALAACALLAAPLLAQVTATVSAQMDIYRAGGYNDGSDGIAPVVYSFPAQPFQSLTFSSVAGVWTCSTGVAKFGADGTTGTGCPTINIPGPVGTFGGYQSVDFLGAMVGMFLEDALPTPAPAALRFYVSDSSEGGVQTDFKALSPKIGQVFFIGDGLTGTGSGSIQVFTVPATATHLYLGYVDACSGGPSPSCYSDNAGSLTAVFQIEQHELNWVSPSVSVTPQARCCMGLAYDYATESTLLFGGDDDAALGDTWSFRQGWTQLSPAVSPSARSGQGMTWDGAAEDIVLFGGVDASGAALNDTWTWNGTTWTQQFPAVSPPARAVITQGLVYDGATHAVVLFGGDNPAGTYFGDTWTWDGLAKTWTQQLPADSPSARRAAMAYDAVTRKVVLFGGDSDGVQYTDTWTWNGATWTQLFPVTSPSARTGTGMAYDATLGGIVLFGGYAGIWEDSLYDTWIWNGINWTEMNPATVPPNCYWAGMTYDPLAHGVMMFGGYSSGPARNDTWLFGLVPVSGARQ